MRTILLTATLLFSILSLPAQQNFNSFFDEANSFFASHVKDGKVDYASVQQDPSLLNKLRSQIKQASLDNTDDNTKQAFYINAYNLLVIGQVIDHYPLTSVLSVNGFFDRNPFIIGGESLTLNQLEKEKLLKAFEDPRFHFVLVCGALDCPPIISEAYLPSQLEQQKERQTRLALNDANFIKIDGENIGLSQIFEWYTSDFGGSISKVKEYINEYRNEALPEGKVRYYTYDWSLNIIPSTEVIEDETGSTQAVAGNNESRYVVSAAVPKGGIEIKGFSNLYSQVTGSGDGNLTDRATFFTQNLSFLYGIHNRFNIGFDARYRQVQFGPDDDSRFDVFNLEQTSFSRQALTGFGPKIRYAPFKALPNFSVQSTYWFATADDLAGTSERPFIDFNGDIWFTQIFNDFSLGNNFSLFTELDLWVEDIGREEDGHINRVSTPVQTIFSYFPNPKTTLYLLGSYSPFWQEEFDYFYQAGAGAKYQLTPQLEFEVLYTAFRNSFIVETGGRASTINFGVRISTF